MARTAALGDGPIAFFNGGVQIEVPLSAIYFDGGDVHTSRTDLPAEFGNWIKFLASQKRLVAADAPPLESAMVATANAPGSPGNNIQVTVGPATNGDLTMADVTVAETDRYEGLTLASLITQLGTSTARGSKPGLLCVRGVIPPNAPDPTATVADIVATTTGTAPPTWKIAGTEGTTGPPAIASTAVTLEPRTAGTAAADIKISIKNVVPPAAGTGATFTMIVSWTKNLPNVALASPPGPLNTAFGYLVAFTAPAGVAKPLRQGTVTLTGGNELIVATQAVATILTPD
jgi:hypothetical protein